MDTNNRARQHLWCIDDLVLDRGKREVTRDGNAIQLPRLSYQLLLALVDKAPNSVSQDDLLEQVWPGRVVSPETLTQRVKLLRQNLGDDAQQPKYIGLVRGEGYRLLASVSQFDESVTERASYFSNRRRLLFAALFIIALVGLGSYIYQTQLPKAKAYLPSSIAVMPFRNLSERTADEYLSAGIGEELIHQLGRVDGLRIAARPSAIAAASSGENAQSISKILSVGTLIEGNLRRQGENIRISIQIIDGATGFVRWAKNYDRVTRDLLAIQQQIAQDVVTEILPESVTDKGRLLPTTVDVNAHDLLLLARHYENQVREQSVVNQELLDKAIELYRSAAEFDPSSAIASSRLGGALLYKGNIDDAQERIFKALNINPDLAEVQTNLGLYYWLRDLPGSGDAWRRAIELNPYNADALGYYAWWLWHTPDNEAPQEYYERALSIDPLSLSRYADLGNYLGMVGRARDAITVARRIEQQFNTADAYSVIARLYELAGRVDKAIQWASGAMRKEPGNRQYAWQVAELYAVLGDFEAARKVEPDPGIGLLFRMRDYAGLQDLGEFLMIDRPEDVRVKHLLAFAYTATAQYQSAIRLLHMVGLPDKAVASENRTAPDIEALAILMNAMNEAGQLEEARRYAQWIMGFMQRHLDTGSRDWWPHVYKACAQSILGQDDRVLDTLAGMAVSERLAWIPVLRDLPCFADYQNTVPFESIITGIRGKQAQLLARIPVGLNVAVASQEKLN